jgi:hypothetical protein
MWYVVKYPVHIAQSIEQKKQNRKVKNKKEANQTIQGCAPILDWPKSVNSRSQEMLL